MNNIRYLSDGDREGFPVITKLINDLDKEKEGEQKQNRWRGLSETLRMESDTPWERVETQAEQRRARYILRTSNGSYYIKCFPSWGRTPSQNVSETQIPTSRELWEQMKRHGVEDNFVGRKSRIWILDYD